MRLYLAICIVALVTNINGQMSPSDSYTHSATLRSGNILLYWKFNDTHITFEVIGQTTGWIGIGFSPNGAMTASDIYVGWVKNGITTVTDRHGASSNTYPPIDPEQNIDVLGGTESDGWTMFKFSRQIASCEAEYDREITSNTEKLIWAYGTTDPTGDDLAMGDYHATNRGAESMYFLQSSDTPEGLPVGPEYNTFDVLATDFTIPTTDTYYNCKLYKLPDFGGKQHIVKWEPIIQPGNELHVHHMIIYRCGDMLANETELGQDARCYTSNMAHFITCQTIIVEWAVGAQAMIYPEVAGFPVGGPGDPIYIQMETHYDNPNLENGVRDSSGIRFTYTSTLRQYEIGVIQIGDAVVGHHHFIPPGVGSFLSTGHCTNRCLQNRMEVSELTNVTVFSVVLHSHLAGRKLRLRHFRDDAELPYLGNDENYDFNYQEARYFSPGVTVKSTDYFQMECDYSTQDRTVMMEGGYGTQQEMCMAFIHYYPKIDLSFCLSTVSHYTSWPYFGIEWNEFEQIEGTEGNSLSHFNLTAPADVAGQTVFEYMNGLNWTEQSIKDFETFYNSALHLDICMPGNISEATFIPFTPPFNITNPYVPPVKQCVGVESTTNQPSSATDEPMTTTSHGHILKPSHLIWMILPYFYLERN